MRRLRHLRLRLRRRRVPLHQQEGQGLPFGNKYCVNCFLCELVCPEDAVEVVLRPKKKKAAATAEAEPSTDT